MPERARWFGGGYDDAGIHSISPDPRDPDRVFIAISCGGVWESRDNGAHLVVLGKGSVAPYVPPEQAEDSAIQDPHRVARCAAAPDVMWMQHHAGIYRSADAGAHWTRSSLPCDDFGFAVVAHPRDAQTAWFVPAIKDEIRMPRDGALCGDAAPTMAARPGRSCAKACRSATPTISSIGMALMSTPPAVRLAMGSTTGALWTSDDGGEGWQPRQRASAADLCRELYLAHSFTIMPSSAVSYGTSARRASMSLLIWVSTRRFGRI